MKIFKLIRKNKLTRTIIALVGLGLLSFSIIVGLLFLALPISPKYKLVQDERQATADIYQINPQNGMSFYDVEVDESVLKIGVPKNLEVKLYYKDNIIGEKSIELDGIRSAKKNNEKYSLNIPFNGFAPDEKDTQHLIIVRITGREDKKYFSRQIKVELDTQGPIIESVDAVPGGAKITGNDINVFVNSNSSHQMNMKFDEPVELSLSDPFSYKGLGSDQSFDLKGFEDGQTSYELDYMALDMAGNLTTGKIIKTLDTEAPIVQLASSSTKDIGDAVSVTTNLKFKSNETLKLIKNEERETKVESDGTYNLSGFKLTPGVNTFEVTAIDFAGNESKITIKITARKSSTLPMCSIETSSYCMRKFNNKPCSDPLGFIKCSKTQCSGATSLTCGGKTYRG